MPDEPAKLIVDTDWKAQAEAEKERLASSAKPAKPAPAAAPGADQEPGPGEPARFEELVSLLASQALAYLGAFPDPRTGQAMIGLDYAKLHIDLLGVLEEKTKGNLSEPESKLIQRVLSELRLEYVDVAKAVEQAVAQGKLRPQQAGGGIATAPSIDLGRPPAR